DARARILQTKPERGEGAWPETPFDVKEKEPLRLLLNATKSDDFGIYQPSLNGVELGKPIDFYSATLDSQEYHLLDFWPEPGHYTLRLQCTGKHPHSTGHYLGLESVRLRERRPRVAKWAWDRDKDWKQKQELYR